MKNNKQLKIPVVLILALFILGCAKDEVSPLEKYKLSQTDNPTLDLVVSQSIGANGGNINMPGFGSIDFPAGSFNSETTVELVKTENSDLKAQFEMVMPLYNIEDFNTHFIQVSCNEFPKGDYVQVTINVSEDVVQNLSAGYGFYLFGLLNQNIDDDDEGNINFDPIDAVYDPISQTLKAEVPSYYFTLNTDRDSKQVLTLAIGTVPGENLSQTLPTTDDKCALFIRCPLNEFFPTSDFNPARTINGVTAPHRGIDLRAQVGTRVYAVSDGEVVAVNVQINPQSKKGWGKYIVIKHTNQLGQVFNTLYAHLSDQEVNNGQLVKEGDLIGLSGKTGTTDPHLHFEYIVGANWGNNLARVNPRPFINNTAVRLKAAAGEMTGTNDCEHYWGDPGSGSSWKVIFDFLDPQNSITDGATLTFQDVEPVVNAPYTVSAGSMISQNGLVSSPTFCARFGDAQNTYFKVKVYLTLPNGSQSNCIYFNLKRPAGARSDDELQNNTGGRVGSGRIL